jgi:hypothetical protein
MVPSCVGHVTGSLLAAAGCAERVPLAVMRGMLPTDPTAVAGYVGTTGIPRVLSTVPAAMLAEPGGAILLPTTIMCRPSEESGRVGRRRASAGLPDQLPSDSRYQCCRLAGSSRPAGRPFAESRGINPARPLTRRASPTACFPKARRAVGQWPRGVSPWTPRPGTAVEPRRGDSPSLPAAHRYPDRSRVSTPGSASSATPPGLRVAWSRFPSLPRSGRRRGARSLAERPRRGSGRGRTRRRQVYFTLAPGNDRSTEIQIGSTN